jgi:UDPglucose 6-dehydrogenase
MSKAAVGIIGCGVVGSSLVELFRPIGCQVYDVGIEGLGTEDQRQRVNASDFAFVCVPTPIGAQGECDTSIVEEVVSWCTSKIIVIRSTIPPGTTARLRHQTGKRIVFQPEYIGETVAHPLLDHQAQGFSVLGGPIEETRQAADLYKGLYHASHRFYFCSATCAELAKYMENAFYAVKVTFCNEFYDIASAFDVEYNELREMWLADPRISRDHTFVYPHARGFGGKCLPKDTSAILAASQQRGVPSPMLQAAMTANLLTYRREDPELRPFTASQGRLVRTSPAVSPQTAASTALTGSTPDPGRTGPP